MSYTATVTANAPGGGTPAGRVDFKDNGVAIGACTGLPLASGSVTCPNQIYASAGTHPITAVYNNADGNYLTSTSATLNEHVVQGTTTAVTPPSGSIVNGAPATLTATVTPHPDTGPGSGTVDFFDGATKICSAAAVNSSGDATCTASLFGVGNHSITATYSGDSLYGTSNSNAAPMTQAVTADATTIALSSSQPNGVVTGQKVSYTAAVTANAPGSGTPAGYVEFQDGSVDVPQCGNVTLSGGQAVCDPVYGSTGSHSITALYHNLDGNYLGSSSPAPLVQMVKQGAGYWMAGSDGGVFTFGGAGFFGSLANTHLNAPMLGMSVTHDRQGYWLVGGDGGVFTLGDAVFYGSMGGHRLNAPIIGIAATPDGGGYYLAASDGGVFTFGDAVYHGSTAAIHLNAPIVAILATPSGHGYWLVAKDGGVFTFGDAIYYGSTGAVHLNAPIVGAVGTPSGHGYWLVAADGGVFTFGDAVFYGSTGGVHLNSPVVGMAATTDGAGYRLFSSDGGVFDFGDATYQGSIPAGGTHINNIVGGA
ncbi:MAG TPA: Ig-like domain-containing protein [Acidimicrobiales bacterium]|nr:Ig-like domain-containing protein [Acidimicrobiales bacterium]